MNNCLKRILRDRSLLSKLSTRQIHAFNPKLLCCSCGPNGQHQQWFAVQFGTEKRIQWLRATSSSMLLSRQFATEPEEKQEPEKKLGLFKRFKQMYRDYWYVLIPVHIFTSCFWVAGLYYIAKSGVDVVALLESLGAGESILKLVSNSNTGYLAVTYALYKIATPARYAITLGGTTLSINYLKRWGYIKPIPPKEKLKEMYQERRDNFKDNLREKKDNFFKTRHKH